MLIFGKKLDTVTLVGVGLVGVLSFISVKASDYRLANTKQAVEGSYYLAWSEAKFLDKLEICNGDDSVDEVTEDGINATIVSAYNDKNKMEQTARKLLHTSKVDKIYLNTFYVTEDKKCFVMHHEYNRVKVGK